MYFDNGIWHWCLHGTSAICHLTGDTHKKIIFRTKNDVSISFVIVDTPLLRPESKQWIGKVQLIVKILSVHCRA